MQAKAQQVFPPRKTLHLFPLINISKQMFSPTTLFACIAATAIASSSRPAFLASAFRIPPPPSALVAKAAKAADGKSPSPPPPPPASSSDYYYDDDDDDGTARASTSSRRRRSFLAAPLLSSLAASFLAADDRLGGAAVAAAADGSGESMYSPKFVQTYDDFAAMPGGWSYKDVKVGNKGDSGGGVTLKDGDRVVFDWSGYTIGYFGRPFEAKG